MKALKLCGILLIATLGMALNLLTTTNSKTLVVCPSGCSFSSIQTAINSAEQGDTIKISSGIYREHLVIAKSISLIGQEASSVIIEGISNEQPVFTIQSVGVEVKILGVTISKGRVGIILDFSAKLDLGKTIISKNKLGIHAQGSSSIRVTESVIRENTGGGEPDLRGSAGGVLLQDNAIAEIISTEISENKVNGLEAKGATKLSVRKSKIIGHPRDGIFSTAESEVDIQDSMIAENGIGVEFLLASQGVIERSQILQQKTIGVRLSGRAKLKISNSRVSKNGDGVYASAQAALEMNFNEVIENRNWGMLLYAEPCFQSVVTPKFEGTIKGQQNKVSQNKQGNFCPSYPGAPWPNGFTSP